MFSSRYLRFPREYQAGKKATVLLYCTQQYPEMFSDRRLRPTKRHQQETYSAKQSSAQFTCSLAGTSWASRRPSKEAKSKLQSWQYSYLHCHSERHYIMICSPPLRGKGAIYQAPLEEWNYTELNHTIPSPSNRGWLHLAPTRPLQYSGSMQSSVIQ